MIATLSDAPRATSIRFDKVSQVLQSESSVGYRRAGLALLAILVPVGILQCILGAPPIAGPWDIANLLDGGWRIVNGQVPHSDFHTPLGPLTYLLVAFGMKIAPPSTSSITYGITLLAALVTPLAWRVSRNRLPWVIAFLFPLLCGFYLLSPRPPGYAFRETSYAMIYNREGYIFLCILCICIFLKPRKSSRQSTYLDGAVVGLFCGLLLYCKITYFAAALGLIVVAGLLIPKSRVWYLPALATFSSVCAAFFAIFHISLRLYLLDILSAGPAQSTSLRMKLLSEGIATNAMWIYLLLFALALWAWVQGDDGRGTIAVLRPWLVAIAIVASALFLESGNTSQGGGADDPLYFAAALVSLEQFRRDNAGRISRSGAPAHVANTASLVLLIPVLFGSILVHDLVSFAYTVAWDIARRPEIASSQKFHSYPLRDFYVPAGTNHITDYWPARVHPARINDGIDLLRRHLQNGDRITTIDYCNPFSFALGTAPAKDGNLWWDLYLSFDLKRHPTPNEFLGDASVVMVPRLTDRTAGFGFEVADTMMGIYGGYLHDHFHEVESTATWTMFRRNQAQ